MLNKFKLSAITSLVPLHFFILYNSLTQKLLHKFQNKSNAKGNKKPPSSSKDCVYVQMRFLKDGKTMFL